MWKAPIRSTNFDANIEWYFAPRAFASIGAFHMEMGSYITNGTYTGGTAINLVDDTSLKSTSQIYAIDQTYNRTVWDFLENEWTAEVFGETEVK